VGYASCKPAGALVNTVSFDVDLFTLLNVTGLNCRRIKFSTRSSTQPGAARQAIAPSRSPRFQSRRVFGLDYAEYAYI